MAGGFGGGGEMLVWRLAKAMSWEQSVFYKSANRPQTDHKRKRMVGKNLFVVKIKLINPQGFLTDAENFRNV